MPIPAGLRAAWAAAVQSVDSAAFRRAGLSLRDFVDSVVCDNDSPQTVAARIVEYFCTDDQGRFNNFMPGLRLGFLFVGSAFRSTAPEPAFRDLQRTLEQPVTRRILEAWAQSHFQ